MPRQHVHLSLIFPFMSKCLSFYSLFSGPKNLDHLLNRKPQRTAIAQPGHRPCSGFKIVLCSFHLGLWVSHKMILTFRHLTYRRNVVSRAMHQAQCSRQIPVNGGKLGELSPPLLLVHYRTFSWSRVTGGQGAQPLFTIRRKIILFIFLASSSSGAGSSWGPRGMRSLVLGWAHWYW